MGNYLTKQGFERLKKELEYLKITKRREIAQRLEKAASYGDLSENAAYDEAKEAQSFLEGKIKELKELLNSAEIIEKKENGEVNISSIVIIKDSNGEEDKYTIVGSAAEANPLEGMISSDSPLGRELIGKKVGERVEVKTPQGKTEYEILKIGNN